MNTVPNGIKGQHGEITLTNLTLLAPGDLQDVGGPLSEPLGDTLVTRAAKIAIEIPITKEGTGAPVCIPYQNVAGQHYETWQLMHNTPSGYLAIEFLCQNKTSASESCKDPGVEKDQKFYTIKDLRSKVCPT